MEEIDWSVGEVMKALDANGLTKNTLVIFTSDNGPWLTFGNHAGNTGGLREGKGTAFEGGVRVPCIMRWPVKIPAGMVSNRMAATFDILPTMVNICGLKSPVKKIDGVNIYPLMINEPNAYPRDEFIYYYDRNNLKGVRKGRWKLVFPHTSQTYLNEGAIGKDGFPGRTAQVEVPFALYDLENDPGEKIDLQSSNADVVKQLSTIADHYRETLGDDLTGKKAGSENRSAAVVKPKE
jgi:arylsulfatase A-like enzyme